MLGQYIGHQHILFCGAGIEPFASVNLVSMYVIIFVRNLYAMFRHVISLICPEYPSFGIRVVRPVTSHWGIFSVPVRIGTSRACSMVRPFSKCLHQNALILSLPAAFQLDVFRVRR